MDTLHHVAISVTDIAKAVEWFRTRLDCRVAYQDDTWAWSSSPTWGSRWSCPRSTRRTWGSCAPTRSRSARSRAHRDGTRSTYLAGPDGNVIEIVDKASVGGELPGSA